MSAPSLDAVAVFVAVVEAGSLAAAARRLEMPKSTVSHRLATLEKRLGVTLLHRTPRVLHPTEAGAAYFAEARRALAALVAAEEALGEDSRAPSGLLRVTTSGNGTGWIGDLMQGFLAAHPLIELDLVLDERRRDLIAEGIDVAIRFGPVGDADHLIAVPIGQAHRKLYASPAWVKAHRALRHPRDLDEAELFLSIGRGDLRLEHPRLASVALTPRGRFRCNQLLALRHQVLAGLGVAALPVGVVQNDVEEGTLIDLLPQWRTERHAVHLVFPRSRRLPARVRAFVDYVKGHTKG